jgi:protein-S-isoprenylcysteine O-methyltransferase Ste14
MLTFARALIYGTAAAGLALIFLPVDLSGWADIPRPSNIGPPQTIGLAVATFAGVLIAWCVFTLAAHLSPPSKRVIVSGPYRYLRHPLYLGAAMAIAGAALYYQSILLLAYASVFLLFLHFFVVLYEEPELQRTFGDEYGHYRQQVGRWGPGTRRAVPRL